ncbi:MAG TPA: M1 family metallopeptidase, partial [Parvularculaceae bacterium]|nr:M1 family metallopeptidase [Parvularculaceae bacterium]
WQNRADYLIRARLFPEKREIAASEVITYQNNSPDALDSLWLRLEQNLYKKDSRSKFAAPISKPLRKEIGGAAQYGITNGFEFDSVAVGGAKANYIISDTRMQIRLAKPLRPHGKVRIEIAYHYTIPGLPGDRTAWGPSKNGDIFSIAQWYPRMAVYDDLRGWDTLPYLLNEFYLDYGDFDYYVTVPSNMLVAGGGELVNPKDVLTKEEIARLDEARASDKTVYIRRPDEVNDPASRPSSDGELTWHFRMKNTRDVAFAASRAFIWDAARINLPEGKSALAMSFYPVEGAGKDSWDRSSEYLKDSVENYSKRWRIYPWPTAIGVGGPATGMEYPGMVFDGYGDDWKGKDFFGVTAHEIGHSWFPMMVGSDERRNAWMDEGFNTFINIYESEDFNNGEWAPKSDGEYAPGGGNPVDEIQETLSDPDAPIIMTRADAIIEKYRHPIDYFKPALGLVLLREQILGPDRFDFAFRKYIRDWSFKHPDPSDFFRTMESAGGEDLSWFWRGWFFNNWSLDLAVQDVSYEDGDPAKGATVRIANLDKLVLPATVEIAFADGSKQDIRLPAETWIQQKEFDLAVDSTQPIASVTIDPDHAIPDEDRSNNVLKGPFRRASAGVSAAK